METTVIVTIGIWFVGILLAIIGFFLLFYFKRSVTSNDNLNESVNKLQNTITGLNATILSQDDRFVTFTGSCKERHATVDHRLNSHAKKLEDHEGRIIKVEAVLIK